MNNVHYIKHNSFVNSIPLLKSAVGFFLARINRGTRKEYMSPNSHSSLSPRACWLDRLDGGFTQMALIAVSDRNTYGTTGALVHGETYEPSNRGAIVYSSFLSSFSWLSRLRWALAFSV